MRFNSFEIFIVETKSPNSYGTYLGNPESSNFIREHRNNNPRAYA